MKTNYFQSYNRHLFKKTQFLKKLFNTYLYLLKGSDLFRFFLQQKLNKLENILQLLNKQPRIDMATFYLLHKVIS